MKTLTLIKTGIYHFTILFATYEIRDCADCYVVLNPKGECIGSANSLPMAQQIAIYDFENKG